VDKDDLIGSLDPFEETAPQHSGKKEKQSLASPNNKLVLTKNYFHMIICVTHTEKGDRRFMTVYNSGIKRQKEIY